MSVRAVLLNSSITYETGAFQFMYAPFLHHPGVHISFLATSPHLVYDDNGQAHLLTTALPHPLESGHGAWTRKPEHKSPSPSGGIGIICCSGSARPSPHSAHASRSSHSRCSSWD